MTSALHLALLSFTAMVAASLAQSQSNPSCFSELSLRTSEEEMQRHVNTLVEKSILSNEAIPVDCLSVLLSRGYHAIALSLYEDHFATSSESNSPIIRSAATTAKRELEGFTNIVMASKQEVQVVEPVFQWAQNKSHVFLQVKLAMRLDSPACLICREELVKIENRTLFMSAYGVISHSPVRFLLNLTLSNDIAEEPEKSTWNYESAGTYFFSIAKKNATNLWIDLEETPTRKVQIWWDMREKHKVHMDEWSKLKEEAVEQAETLKREARRKAKQDKKQARLEQQKAKKEKQQQKKKEVEEEEKQKKDSSWGGWFSNLTN